MNPFVVREKEGDINMEEGKDHEDKEEKRGSEDEEKMEEEDGSVGNKKEMDEDDEVMGEEKDEETEDASILEPVPGEEEGGRGGGYPCGGSTPDGRRGRSGSP